VLDEEAALAEALVAALTGYEEFLLVTATSDPTTAASTVRAGGVDVLILGADAEEWDALSFIEWVSRRHPTVALVAMSGNEDPQRVTRILLAGAASWLPKRSGVDSLVTVVLGAVRGESSVPPRMLRQVLRELSANSGASRRSSVLLGLTAREREILEYAVMGLSRGEIAGELGLSINTVRTHLQHILSKLGVRTTLEAVTLVLHERAASNGEGRP